MTTRIADSPSPQRVGVQRTLSLDVSGAPDVLVRVLTTLRRRGCAIMRVDYAAGDHHYPGRFEIGIDAPAQRAQCVDSWVANLVDVQAVHSWEA
jgi:acetolactate synthase regulatory subunit